MLILTDRCIQRDNASVQAVARRPQGDDRDHRFDQTERPTPDPVARPDPGPFRQGVRRSAAFNLTRSTGSETPCGPAPSGCQPVRSFGSRTGCRPATHTSRSPSPGAATRLCSAFRAPNLTEGRKIAIKVLDSFLSCPHPRIARFGRTLRAWKDQFST
jgi:hypothetical protein